MHEPQNILPTNVPTRYKVRWHGEDCINHHQNIYMFPEVKKDHSLDFSKPYTYLNHKRAAQRAL